jgi:hypothetical protein
MCKLFSFPVWLALSLVWTGAVAYFGYTTAPHVPMDMSPNDPATQEALRAATSKHAIMFGLLAAVPPAIALVFGRLVCGRGA